MFPSVGPSVGPLVGPSVGPSVMLLSAGRDEPANDLFCVYELVCFVNSLQTCKVLVSGLYGRSYKSLITKNDIQNKYILPCILSLTWVRTSDISIGSLIISKPSLVFFQMFVGP